MCSVLLLVCLFLLKGSDRTVDRDMIAALVEDTLYTTHPAMILNLRACVSSPAVKIPISIAISHNRCYAEHSNCMFCFDYITSAGFVTCCDVT